MAEQKQIPTAKYSHEPAPCSDPEPDQDSPEVSDHTDKLLLYCRVCGKPTCGSQLQNPKLGKPVPVSQYWSIIEHLYGSNLQNDNMNIHPSFVCATCDKFLKRAQKAKNSRKTYHPKQKKLATFYPHSENCMICSWQQRKTPRKTPHKTPGKTPQKSADHSLKLQTGPPAKKKLLFLDLPEETWQIHADRFIESELAFKMKCNICNCISNLMIVTGCQHLFCKKCISCEYDISMPVCPTCKNVLADTDVTEISHMVNLLCKEIHVKCKFNPDGCTVVCKIDELADHESDCLFSKYPAKLLAPSKDYKGVPHKHKQPLKGAKSQYVKRKRLADVIEFVRKYCQEHHENVIDVLFFVLHNELKYADENDRALALQRLWHSPSKGDASFSPEECLAMRIESLESKTQYTYQYQLLKLKGEALLQSPDQVDKVEPYFLPTSVEYAITDPNSDHPPLLPIVETPCYDEGPTDICMDYLGGIPEAAPPNVKGARWNYPRAIACTLKELDYFVTRSLELHNILDTQLILTAVIKDGGDGMGDTSIYKERGDRPLPDKAFRYAFCIMEIHVNVADKMFELYSCENPNSVRQNRPLLESIADENNKSAAAICLVPIEFERSSLAGKFLTVKVDEKTHRHYTLKFISSMEDEKFDRAFGGLQGAGSSYLCTLCHATTGTAVEKVGTFNIERTIQETNYLADYMRANPDNLSQVALSNLAKGVKSVPLLLSQPKDRLMDATHADINMARFFKKLIVRVIAGVKQWEETPAYKDKLLDAESKFDKLIKKEIGSNPMLMMPGNYARMLFGEKHRSVLVSLISNQEDRDNMISLLEAFGKMRATYRATKPDLASVQSYKKIAVGLGKSLREKFAFARWPNYLHKLIEHVQEILLDPNGPSSIGAYSGEGLEAGNKLFRHIRKNLANRGSTYSGLIDVLKIHWLYSSPALQRLAQVSHQKYKCGTCGELGHNRLTCPKATE